MNKCIFIGNLTRDFEYRTGTINVARGGMALNKGKDKEADFINLVAFRDTADLLDKYGKKGKKIAVETHLNTNSYVKDGVLVKTIEFIVDRVEFIDSKPVSAEPQQEAEGFMEIPEGFKDEELPFM